MLTHWAFPFPALDTSFLSTSVYKGGFGNDTMEGPDTLHRQLERVDLYSNNLVVDHLIF